MTPDSIARVRSELGLVDLADATQNDLDANALIVGNKQPLSAPPSSAVWFIPIVDHVLKGGVRTIFSTAEQMSKNWGTQTIFVVYSFSGRDFPLEALDNQLRINFPSLKFSLFKFRKGINTVAEIPISDIAFCTLWTTAYLLLKYNKTKKKFYFMQDYEPVFYAGGSVYGVIEATYRFGFKAIANTQGVAQRYRKYSSDVMSFTPGIDLSVFNPGDRPQELGDRWRVVFYGRPQNDRNGFALGLRTLQALKSRLGNRVDIISVGAQWNPADFGVQTVLRNEGLLTTLEEVADLYRSSHLGLVFMFSAHPSYQPLEYMACGCVPVTNVNENNEWLLQNDVNCLFLNPSPASMADQMANLLETEDRWARLRASGIRTARALEWDTAYRSILEFVQK